MKRPETLPDEVDSVPLPDAGHIPMWDAPDAVAALLMRASEPGGTPVSARARRGT